MSEAVEHNPSNDAVSHGSVSFCGYEPLNTFLNTALHATGYYSALPRAVVNGEEPYASLFRQLATNAAQAAQHPSTVTVQLQQRRGRPVEHDAAFTQDYRDAYRKLQDAGNRRPSQDQIAAELLMDKRTLQRRIRKEKEAGKPWPPWS